MCVLRWALLVLVVGSLSGAEYTPTIETLEIEDLIERIYIQHLIYYPEENNTTIIYKI